ncbi:MAG: DUF1989 domain-containing protein [Granulosicoccus sp.]
MKKRNSTKNSAVPSAGTVILASSIESPKDADTRRQATPIVCYEVSGLPPAPDAKWLQRWRNSLTLVEELEVPAREARVFNVPAGHAFRIVSVEGPQVGDLNLWNADNLDERFFSGKTRQLHATHVTRGDRLWSTLPSLRSLASITADSLEWYGWDADGAGVHDVIGTRCDPYTNYLLKGTDYHYCCHSNLVRALADHTGMSLKDAAPYIHDVLNIFMCTGFKLDTHQYFMKASPVRPGDAIEFLAEIDLLAALSSCPGGDCGSSHSDDSTRCYPLRVEILKPASDVLSEWQIPPVNGYCGSHGR